MEKVTRKALANYCTKANQPCCLEDSSLLLLFDFDIGDVYLGQLNAFVLTESHKSMLFLSHVSDNVEIKIQMIGQLVQAYTAQIHDLSCLGGQSE